jgi:hypothetical protein
MFYCLRSAEQMPVDFDKCKQAGGKIRTISGPNQQYGLEAGEYMRVCVKDGIVTRGEKKQKKEIGQLHVKPVNNKNINA